MGNLVNVLYPTLNDQAAAASNVTRIQALLDAGGDCQLAGSGTVWINAPILIGSNTNLKVSPKITIKMTPQAGNLGKNLLQNKGYTRALTTVTLTWSNTNGGLDCSVAWAAHGLSVGDLIVVKGTAGTTDSAFSGVFPRHCSHRRRQRGSCPPSSAVRAPYRHHSGQTRRPQHLCQWWNVGLQRPQQ